MARVYVKEQVCIGCRLCEVYCQLSHSGHKELVKAFRGPNIPVPRLRVEVDKHVSFSVRCQNCEDAPCVHACITGALSRNSESGQVICEEERCVGCWTCTLVCPYGAIRQNQAEKRMAKCDLCPEEEIPACVANCPNEALIFAADEEQVVPEP